MGHRFPEPKQDKNSENKVDVDEVILGLKRQRDNMIKYQRRLESENENILKLARHLVKNNQKERAKTLLRQKKQKEVLINKADQMINNLQAQVDQIETTQQTIEYVKFLDQTNAILKQMNQLMPIEEVERIMDENQELGEKLDEISGILYNTMSQEDLAIADEEYEKMLENMTQEDNAENNIPVENKQEQQNVEQVEDQEEEIEENNVNEKPEKISVLA